MPTRLLLVTLVVCLVACGSSSAPSEPSAEFIRPGVLLNHLPDPQFVPQLVQVQQQRQAALASSRPVVLRQLAQPDQATAQQLAVADPRVQEKLFDAQQGAPLLAEVFTVRPAQPGDLTETTTVGCRSGCLRVEMYHYALNSTSVVLVAPAKHQVVGVAFYPGSQPADIPAELAELATALARQDPVVQQQLGVRSASDPVMANIKTALNATRCERAQQLCVAPTFHAGNQEAAWVIVNLTELRVVGIQFTKLGAAGPPITMRAVEDQAVSAAACEHETLVERDGWRFTYVLTGSDGLRLSQVSYHNQLVLRSISVVDWHVSYSGKQQFGYSDAIGCPRFSAAAVPAWSLPQVEPLADGFVVVQDFQHPDWPHPCQYRYQQRYEFYRDGRLRPLAVSQGRGCGTPATYRPVLRLALAEQPQVRHWQAGGWSAVDSEGWYGPLASTQSFEPLVQATWPTGHQLTIRSGAVGQPDERGDRAYIYLTRWKAQEGEADLPTLGSCCNTDYQQGPELFATPAESLRDQPVTLWYVAQLTNDHQPGREYCWAEAVARHGRYEPQIWPCQAGPLLQIQPPPSR